MGGSLSNIICSFVLIMAALSLTANNNTAKQDLLLSIGNFNKGNYRKAIKNIEHLDIRKHLDNVEDMKLGFKIRAISYEQTGQTELAKKTIKELFFLDPNYNFDPFDSPKSVVEIAKKEKSQILKKSNELLSVKKSSSESKNILMKKPAFVNNFFPFGVNHFSLKSPVKGSIYLSLQAAGVVTNVLSFWWKQSYLSGFNSPRLIRDEARNKFNAVQAVQFVGLGIALVGYVVSVIDAMITHKDISSHSFRPKTSLEIKF